ncbi:MAG: hypothetical protein M9894_10950 [Planctomycetes bacterium]|nr:hypothetical protein [Planctomycetota bacterium]
MKRALAPLALLAALPLAGCPDRPARRGADAAALEALDPTVRRVAGLERTEPTPVATWDAAMTSALTAARTVRGWEVVDGAAAVRVDLAAQRKGVKTTSTEWLRPAGDRLECVARAIGRDRARLDPPQPVLAAPLEPGRTWRWEGTCGGAPAAAEFRVRAAGVDEGGRLTVEVEQTTRAAGLDARRVVTWVEGLGVVKEEGTQPAADDAERPERYDLRPLAAGS